MECGIQVPLKINPESSTWSPESRAKNPESKTILEYLKRRDRIIGRRGEHSIQGVISFYSTAHKLLIADNLLCRVAPEFIELAIKSANTIVVLYH